MSEQFDVDAYLKCDCAEHVNQTCDKCALRAYIEEIEDAGHTTANENARLNQALIDERFESVSLRESRDALQRFKSYVHQRLDEAGIPTHPEGPHSAEGCRVGDRLDIALKHGFQKDIAP